MGHDSARLGFRRLTSGSWEGFSYGKWSRFPIPSSLKDPSKIAISSIYEDSARRVWYSLLNHLEHYYCVQNGELTDYSGVTPHGAFVTYRDEDGLLWLTDHQGHTARWKRGREEPFDGVNTYRIFRVIVDREGDKWIATQDQGLFRVRRPLITSIPHPGGAEIGSATLRDRSGSLWIGAIGLVRYRDSGFRTFLRIPNIRTEWSPTIVNARLEDKAGTLLVGTREGLCTFVGEHFTAQALGDYSKTSISSPAGNGWSELAIGTDTGVLLYKSGKAVPFKAPGLPSLGPVRTLLYARSRRFTAWPDYAPVSPWAGPICLRNCARTASACCLSPVSPAPPQALKSNRSWRNGARE